MGGNTKILFELINNLSEKYDFVVFTSEEESFKKNINNIERIKLVVLPYPFKKMSYGDQFKEIRYVTNFYDEYFKSHRIKKEDYFYAVSDFAPDVIPLYRLRAKHKFIWIPTLFLFIPNPIENIVKSYEFPFLKYIVYFLYQRYLFLLMRRRLDLCVITNIADKKYFPKSLWDKVLPIYGGVNKEQIEEATSGGVAKKEYEAVFCSRLHPQKGIGKLLDAWRLVVGEIPNARIVIIGNGEKEYEEYLKNKALDLGLEKNILWLGYVNNTDKYKIYLKSKMLLHATVYDNNGMVATEALCSGIPVVLYDLENFKKLYSAGCVKVTEGNIVEYSKAVIKMLNDEEYYKSICPNKKDIIRLRDEWSWENRASIFNVFISQEKVYAGDKIINKRNK